MHKLDTEGGVQYLKSPLRGVGEVFYKDDGLTTILFVAAILTLSKGLPTTELYGFISILRHTGFVMMPNYA